MKTTTNLQLHKHIDKGTERTNIWGWVLLRTTIKQPSHPNYLQCNQRLMLTIFEDFPLNFSIGKPNKIKFFLEKQKRKSNQAIL